LGDRAAPPCVGGVAVKNFALKGDEVRIELPGFAGDTYTGTLSGNRIKGIIGFNKIDQELNLAKGEYRPGINEVPGRRVGRQTRARRPGVYDRVDIRKNHGWSITCYSPRPRNRSGRIFDYGSVAERRSVEPSPGEWMATPCRHAQSRRRGASNDYDPRSQKPTE